MAMNPPIQDWSGRRVWVVGASSGIGAALAEALVDAGARVAVSARREEALAALAARRPGQVLPLALDVTDPTAVHEAWQRVEATWDGLDAVFCVAGVYVPMRAAEFDPEVARTLFDVNVMGVVHVLDAVLPALRASRGHLVIVASVAGYRALPKALFYGATKAALIHLAEGLYLDLAPEGLGVSVVNPGFVRTPATAGNEFRMPALIDADEAARETLRGLARGEFEIHYPKRFTRWLKLMRLLPYRWYFSLVHKATGL
jgi:NAD(P)-dependent dehydrogenase (short-subunit alcohol dehydrogenase family)